MHIITRTYLRFFSRVSSFITDFSKSITIIIKNNEKRHHAEPYKNKGIRYVNMNTIDIIIKIGITN
jgi:hypothetical protein